MRTSLMTLFFTGLVILNTGCSSTEPEQKKEARYVKIEEVQPQITANAKTFNAAIEENRKSSVPFRVGGPLEKIFFDEGDFVKKGQILAQLDKRDFKTRLLAAEAQFTQAKGEFERYSQLYEQNKLPANTYEKIKSAYLAAKSNWENASNALSDTRLTAPFSGFVFQKLINNHETIAPGQPVLILIDTNTLEVNFGVPESVVNTLKEGQEVGITVNHHTDNRHSATIHSISHKAGDDRLFHVRLKMKNPDPEIIKPGMTAKAIVAETESKKSSRPVVPTEAIFYSGNQPNVWIFNETNNQVSRRPVTTGLVNDEGMIQIAKGIQPNEKIVTAGVHSLLEGQKVKPLSQNTSF
ncbi:efflux RND transporter periplasmic adaptor subunit [Marinilabilia rubra]|uniref:Efflux RND transporter periplasmic adaptor subunit n=1 Tax=Marinilabilia rubra TaxID=2162893 RepID=A0A2U2B4K0_9BACT|nr:efflux RND transporter periplasmic adaptor subunit [Marinilabilia rubra]PWD97964.1 efflux RND transporter periplasmic adaptor subunit [Marinilabilia rubra]